MEESDRQENLRLVYQSQRAEALQHRLSISNAYSLVMTGLIVVLGVIFVSADSDTPSSLKILTGIGVLIVGLLTCVFMWRQRSESNKVFKILRKIEKEFGFFEKDRYLPGEVLPIRWQKRPRSLMGFQWGDWIQVASLLGLMIVVELAVCYL